MIDVIKRTYDNRAFITTLLFTMIYFGINDYLYARSGIPLFEQRRQLVELGGFFIAGLLYGLVTARHATSYITFDLMGVGVWVALATGVGSLISVFFVDTADLPLWTMLGIEGSLLAVAISFVAVIAHNPALIGRDAPS